jgi:DNA-binding CsgD family transcriptional regulator
VLAETVDHLLRSLPQDELPVLEISLQGYTTSQISERLGLAERPVHRTPERIRKRLERMQRGDV